MADSDYNDITITLPKGSSTEEYTITAKDRLCYHKYYNQNTGAGIRADWYVGQQANIEQSAVNILKSTDNPVKFRKGPTQVPNRVKVDPAQAKTDIEAKIRTTHDMRMFMCVEKWIVKQAAVDAGLAQNLIAGSILTKITHYNYNFKGSPKPFSNTIPVKEFMSHEVGESLIMSPGGWNWTRFTGGSPGDRLSRHQLVPVANASGKRLPGSYSYWSVTGANTSQFKPLTPAECNVVVNLEPQYCVPMYKIEQWLGVAAAGMGYGTNSGNGGPIDTPVGFWKKNTKHTKGWYNHVIQPSISISCEHDCVESLNNIQTDLVNGEEIEKITYKQLQHNDAKGNPGGHFRPRRVVEDLTGLEKGDSDASAQLMTGSGPKSLVIDNASDIGNDVSFVIDNRNTPSGKFGVWGPKPVLKKPGQYLKIQAEAETTSGALIKSDPIKLQFGAKKNKTYRLIPYDKHGNRLKLAAPEAAHDYELTLDQQVSFRFKPMHGAETAPVADVAACELHVKELNYRHLMEHSEPGDTTLTYTNPYLDTNKGSRKNHVISGFTYGDVKNSTDSGSDVLFTPVSHNFLHEAAGVEAVKDTVIQVIPAVTTDGFGKVIYDGVSNASFGDGSVRIKLVQASVAPSIEIASYKRGTGSMLFNGDQLENRRAVIEQSDGAITAVLGHKDSKRLNDDRGRGYRSDESLTVNIVPKDPSNFTGAGADIQATVVKGQLHFEIVSAGAGYDVDQIDSITITSDRVNGAGIPPTILELDTSDFSGGGYLAPDYVEYYTGDTGITIEPLISSDVREARLEWQLSSPGGLAVGNLLNYDQHFRYEQAPDESDDAFAVRAPKGGKNTPHVHYGDWLQRTLHFALAGHAAAGQTINLKVYMIANGHRVLSTVQDIYVAPDPLDEDRDYNTNRNLNSAVRESIDVRLGLTNQEIYNNLQEGMLSFVVQTGTLPFYIDDGNTSPYTPTTGYENNPSNPVAIGVAFHNALEKAACQLVRFGDFPGRGYDRGQTMAVDYVLNKDTDSWDRRRAGSDWQSLINHFFPGFEDLSQDKQLTVFDSLVSKGWWKEDNYLKNTLIVLNDDSSLGTGNTAGVSKTTDSARLNMLNNIISGNARLRLMQLKKQFPNPTISSVANNGTDALTQLEIPIVSLTSPNVVMPGDIFNAEVTLMDSNENDLGNGPMFVNNYEAVISTSTATTTSAETTDSGPVTTPTTTTTPGSGGFTVTWSQNSPQMNMASTIVAAISPDSGFHPSWYDVVGIWPGEAEPRIFEPDDDRSGVGMSPEYYIPSSGVGQHSYKVLATTVAGNTTQINSGINSVATTLTVPAGQGNNFSANDIVVIGSTNSYDNSKEYVKVVSTTANTIVVQRALYGNARSHSQDANVTTVVVATQPTSGYVNIQVSGGNVTTTMAATTTPDMGGGGGGSSSTTTTGTTTTQGATMVTFSTSTITTTTPSDNVTTVSLTTAVTLVSITQATTVTTIPPTSTTPA